MSHGAMALNITNDLPQIDQLIYIYIYIIIIIDYKLTNVDLDIAHLTISWHYRTIIAI